MEDGKRESFLKAAKPLMDWLNTEVHPHHTALVDGNGAQLLEGQCTVGLDETT